MKTNRSFEIIKEIYKPYRVTIKGKSTIIETTEGKYVIKEKNKDLKELYTYLKSRSFEYFPNLIDESRKDINVFEYIEDIKTPKEQKAEDIINITSALHNKTTYYKVVSEDNYKEIYENVKNNLLCMKDYYSKMITNFEYSTYNSPSEYLIMRNYSKINSAINFGLQEIDEWYEMVKTKNKQRVCLIHNNLRIDHLINNKNDYLISWENSKIDTPILDLINFYQNEYLNINFEHLLNLYQKKYELTKDEIKLFLIVISIPKKIELEKNELKNCQNIRLALDYLFITENLVGPYYSKKEEE